MAGTISITTSMSRSDATNTADTHTIGTIRSSVTQTGAGQDDRKFSIGTTEESLTFTDIATNGFVMLQNLDATNYVQWGFATTAYGGRMRAGEQAGPFRLEPGATLYLKANTAACRVRAVHYED